jgi:hypothetical protein
MNVNRQKFYYWITANTWLCYSIALVVYSLYSLAASVMFQFSRKENIIHKREKEKISFRINIKK